MNVSRRPLLLITLLLRNGWGGAFAMQPICMTMDEGLAESGHAHERVGAQAGGRAWPSGPHVIFNVAVFISCSWRRAVRFCRVTWSTRCPLRNTHTIFRCFPFWAFVYNVVYCFLCATSAEVYVLGAHPLLDMGAHGYYAAASDV
jgi:hypothetical protein